MDLGGGSREDLGWSCVAHQVVPGWARARLAGVAAVRGSLEAYQSRNCEKASMFIALHVSYSVKHVRYKRVTDHVTKRVTQPNSSIWAVQI